MINKSPAFQFYPDDWNNDAKVIAMSPEEEGHYIRLCGICWKEGSLPAHPEELQALLKGRCENLDKIMKCFYLNPKNNLQLLHKRLEKERKKQKAWRLKSAKGGRKSRKTNKLEQKKEDKGGVSTLTRVVEPKRNTMSLDSDSVSDSDSTSKDLKDIRGKNVDQQKSKPLDPETKKLWAACLVQIKLNIMPEYFQNYFETTTVYSFEENILRISVPNQYTRKCLIEIYRKLIESTVKEIWGKSIQVDFCVNN